MSSRVDLFGGFTTGHTYVDDAKFIETIWVYQLVVCIICIFTSNIGCFKCCNRKDLFDSQIHSTMHSDNQNLL